MMISVDTARRYFENYPFLVQTLSFIKRRTLLNLLKELFIIQRIYSQIDRENYERLLAVKSIGILFHITIEHQCLTLKEALIKLSSKPEK